MFLVAKMAFNCFPYSDSVKIFNVFFAVQNKKVIQLDWEVLPYIYYSSNIALNDNNSFGSIQNHLFDKSFEN